MTEATLTVGLTGGLACGKSTVLATWRERAIATVDADALAREALEPGSPLVPRVVELLGSSVLDRDGTLDRMRVAALVFADPEKRRALEGIVHPEVIRREEELTAAHAAGGAPIVVVDAALLVEIGRHRHFHRLVVVSCSPATQLARAVLRGMDPDDARRRIASQLPLAEKVALADYAIDTEGTLADTRHRALVVLELLAEDARCLREGRPLPERPRGDASSASSTRAKAAPAASEPPAGD